MDLNHNESLFTAGCLVLTNYLNLSIPELWADWKEMCWRICSQKNIERESKNCRSRLHRVRWKTLRVEPSETAASFGEGDSRLQRTDSALKSSELQENTRPCRPVLLLSSFTPGDFTGISAILSLCSEPSVFSLDKDRGYRADIFSHFCLDLVSRQA